MSWFKPFLFCLTLFLASCTVHPLYGTLGTPQMLSNIEVNTPSGREGTRLRTTLLEKGVGATKPSENSYTLDIALKSSSQWIAVESISGRPSTIFYTLTATLTLKDSKGEIVLQDSLFAKSAYDWSGQRFANDRAAINASERVVGILADQIKTRLAIALKP